MEFVMSSNNFERILSLLNKEIKRLREQIEITELEAKGYDANKNPVSAVKPYSSTNQPRLSSKLDGLQALADAFLENSREIAALLSQSSDKVIARNKKASKVSMYKRRFKMLDHYQPMAYRAVELHDCGMSYADIAEQLNKEGFRSSRGALLRSMHIHRQMSFFRECVRQRVHSQINLPV
jgi:hypothetical protein